MKRRLPMTGQGIAGSSKYSFTVDLQRPWLDRHRRIDWVKDDLAEAIARWKQSAQIRAGRPGDSSDEHALPLPPRQLDFAGRCPR